MASPAFAAIATDGSVGPAQALSGPNYAVTPGLGQQRGANLFHSFSRFDLASGETATFSGPASVHNVLARVTGGSASNIDGTLRCTIPDANFYLINPAGVVFGPNAALDVKGAFAVTTADVVKLSDGGAFHATTPGASVLTSAPPSAFGFLGTAAPAPIAVNGASLVVPQGKVLSIVSGSLQVNDAELRADAGRVNLLSVASAGDAAFDPGSMLDAIDVQSFTQFGQVQITSGSGILASGAGGGRVSVRAADLLLDSSEIRTDTLGAVDGLGIDLVLSGTLTVTNALIATDSSAAGRAGPLSVMAGSIMLDSGGNPSAPSGLSAAAGGSGAGGAVRVAASGDIHITGGAAIDASTSGAGNAGTVNVQAGNLLLDGGGIDRFTLAPALRGTGIFARAAAPSGGGAGGQVTVQANSIRVIGGAAISADSLGSAPAGVVTLTGQSLLVDDQDLNVETAVSADAQLSGAGKGGQVVIDMHDVTVQGGGFISAGTYGLGDAGSVNITASSITVDGPPHIPSEITADSFNPGPSGKAGSVTLTTGDLTLTGTSLLSAGTVGEGPAGTVSVAASGTVTIDGRGGALAEIGAFSAAQGADGMLGTAPRGGNAGDVSIRTDTLYVLPGGLVIASAAGPGNGGSIDVTATTVQLDAAGAPQLTGIFAEAGSAAGSATNGTATPGVPVPAGGAGSIALHAGNIALFDGAIVSASTLGTGHGGFVSVDAGTLTIDGSNSTEVTGIVANTLSRSAGGAAGAITVNADNILLQNTGTISSDTFGLGRGGNVSVIATQSLTIDGGGVGTPTGIFASTRSTGAGGDAGAVQVQAASLDVTNAGRIGSDTYGLGNGGGVDVSAGQMILANGPVNIFTGVSALSRSNGAGGRGGNVVVHTDALQVLDGARISSETLGQGDGGDVQVTVNQALFDSTNVQAGAGIVADSTADGPSGRAGTVSVDAQRLQISAGALVSSSTFGLGAGGGVMIHAGHIVIDGAGSADPSGILSTSGSFIQGGRAGDIRVRAGNFQIFNGGGVSSGTVGSGPGGAISIEAHRLQLGGRAGMTGSSVEASAAGTLPGGDGGDVTIAAGHVVLSDSAAISTDAAGPNHAGAVTVRAGGVQLNSQSVIDSASFGTGPAGSVVIAARRNISVRNGTISTAAQGASAGGIVLTTGSGLYLDGSTLSAEAAGEGGSITVRSSNTVDIRRSSVLTQAGGNGGNIFIDPTSIVLDRALLSANGGGDGGNITLRSQGLLTSAAVLTATGATGISGQVQTPPPDNQLAGEIVPLATSLAPLGATLAPACGVTLNGSISSFVVTGRGGVPLEPGGWVPAGTPLAAPKTQPPLSPATRPAR